MNTFRAFEIFHCVQDDIYAKRDSIKFLLPDCIFYRFIIDTPGNLHYFYILALTYHKEIPRRITSLCSVGIKGSNDND